jgi:hypothetical protein
MYFIYRRLGQIHHFLLMFWCPVGRRSLIVLWGLYFTLRVCLASIWLLGLEGRLLGAIGDHGWRRWHFIMRRCRREDRRLSNLWWWGGLQGFLIFRNLMLLGCCLFSLKLSNSWGGFCGKVLWKGHYMRLKHCRERYLQVHILLSL